MTFHNSSYISLKPSFFANNYYTWSIKLKAFLSRIELWGVINGSKVAPNINNFVQHHAYNSKDVKSYTKILLYCKNKQLMILQKLPIPKVFWNYMKNIYKQSNKAS